MELQFETLDYQTHAIQAAVDLFIGQPNQQTEFGLKAQNDMRFVANLPLQINDEQLQQNLAKQQNKFNFYRTLIGEQGRNFTVEMETGTGKTYVYLRTIFELNRQYGWQKFVIVVPSVPIREGVLHTLETTRSHFATLFDNPSVNPKYEYKSNQLSRLKAFATGNHIEILVMNIDAFAKESNVINTLNESGDAPIRYIQNVNPIVIIDEPQNMETDIRRHAIASLNPLFTLRYSATHKNAYNPIFRLNPVQAYELGLVKQIEVDSVLADNDVNGAYVALKEINAGAKSWSAKVEILVNDKSMKKKVVTVKPNQDLFDLSKQNEVYRNGYILEGMNVEEQQIEFSGGLKVTKGVDNSLLKDDIQKMQIRRTIEEHLRKEKILNPLGIKVLSLFFIDKVDNYRNDGKFYQWFEEIYRELTHGKAPVGVHEGYFSKDKKGVLKDTNGTTQADNDTYHLIMRDKETLLSLDKPLRFIFSHSALREGWDNPNVFQICTLNDTHSEIKKRQEIGRGLRLPVNQLGVRSHERDKNILTVIANESYEEFATKLQREIEEDCGVSFDKGQIKNKLDRKYVRYRKDFSQHPEFAAIWERIKHQTTYRVNFSQDELIDSAVKNLVKMPRIDEVKIRHEKVAFAINEKGVTTEYRSSNQVTSKTHWDIPDVLGELQKKTGLTRQTICHILQKSKRLSEIYHNPQRFIDLVAEKINEALSQIMADGVEYHRIDDRTYEMTLFKDFEFYLNQYSFSVSKQSKTIYEGYIALDSNTENTFAHHCESSEDVEFYFKLPKNFKIPTPLGNYNPDWAVVFKGQNKVYFVAETKNTGKGIQRGVDEGKLDISEQMKITYARKNFEYLHKDYDDLEYRVVQSVDELSETVC